MGTLILPAPTIDEQEAEDFDPIPQIALANITCAVTSFQAALPVGPRSYRAWFAGLPGGVLVGGVRVRYSELIPWTYLPFKCSHTTWPGDEWVVTLHTGEASC